MLQAQKTQAPLMVNPSLGIFLLLLWLNDEPKRKRRFLDSLRHMKKRGDFKDFSLVIEQAAERCLMDFVELYPDIAEVIEEEDMQTLYKYIRSNYTN